ncbi:MAG: hypothetical protein H6624_00880 [Bdellovibrionaceae bacterium]|nr:hypothetical protein [Bdellovibrionales bacterium]MCB9082863.1 hypothetical protein [Pseudobdellovibrionaceae bacterium]
MKLPRVVIGGAFYLLLGISITLCLGCSTDGMVKSSASSGTPNPPNSLTEAGGGHGSGYDGKIHPGLYVHQEPENTCYLEDGSASHVTSMVRVYADDSINFFDSCREENPLPIQEADVKALSETTVEYQSQIFEYSDSVPRFAGPPPPPPPPPPPVEKVEARLMGVCHFRDLDPPNFVGALTNLRTAVYEDTQAKTNFSMVEIDEVEIVGQAFSTTGFPKADTSLTTPAPSQLGMGTFSGPYNLEVIILDLVSGDAEMRFKLPDRPFGIGAFRPGACSF